MATKTNCDYELKKEVKLTENVKLDGTIIHQFTATINSDDPVDCKLSEIPMRSHAQEYRNNRDEISEKYKAFQDEAWALSDQMAGEGDPE